jgi:hypothetical protein
LVGVVGRDKDGPLLRAELVKAAIAAIVGWLADLPGRDRASGPHRRRSRRARGHRARLEAVAGRAALQAAAKLAEAAQDRLRAGEALPDALLDGPRRVKGRQPPPSIAPNRASIAPRYASPPRSMPDRMCWFAIDADCRRVRTDVSGETSIANCPVMNGTSIGGYDVMRHLHVHDDIEHGLIAGEPLLVVQRRFVARVGDVPRRPFP